MSRKDVVSSSINFVRTFVYLLFLLNLVIAVKPKGFSMKMIRSDSKESPLHLRYANLTQAERFQRLVEQSKARARYFGSARAAAYNKSSSMNPDMVRSPVRYMDGRNYYIGQIGIGNISNQPQYYYLIMDTGSDLIWTQCQGGYNYFYQDLPIYNQKSSNTYRRIPCVELKGCRCEDNLCTYRARYDNEYGPATSGHLAYETFTMKSSRGEYAREILVGLIMGCGINQRNFGPSLGVPEKREGHHVFPPPIPAPGTAPIAGVLGLGQGRSHFSLVKQLDSNDKFEYCLQPYDRIPAGPVGGSHTYLRFGSDTIIGGPGGPAAVFRTPIIQDKKFGTAYHLILEDISVGGKRAGFQSRDFKMTNDGKGGTIMDSGAPFTTMVRPLFERVKKLVLDYFEEGFGIRPTNPDPNIVFDPCWVVPKNFNKFPTMTFHFKDADFLIRQMSGIFAYYDENLLCFGIIGVNEYDYDYDVLFGAMQQANKRILYDSNDLVLSFVEEECRTGS